MVISFDEAVKKKTLCGPEFYEALTGENTGMWAADSTTLPASTRKQLREDNMEQILGLAEKMVEFYGGTRHSSRVKDMKRAYDGRNFGEFHQQTLELLLDIRTD
ncbi:hypothetical protein J4402_03080 [Candidatus Pacearchaeota archaeon]|nr:hypothetical protein [Candidatus Pacearchaeota archaeon]